MILSFKKQFPWGDQTDFVRKIKLGIKNTTIRESEKKVGQLPHLATGGRTSNYEQFGCIDLRY